MDQNSYAAICAKVNAYIDVTDLIGYIGWYPERMTKSGEVYLALCPVHREELFRTLELNPRNNTYQCSHVLCPAHRPADFLDLLVRSFDQTLPAVIVGVIDYFGPDYFRLTEKQVAVIRQLAKEAASAS